MDTNILTLVFLVILMVIAVVDIRAYKHMSTRLNVNLVLMGKLLARIRKLERKVFGETDDF